MSRACVYRYFNAEGALLYVGSTKSPAARHSQHGSRSPWAGSIAVQTVDWFETEEAAAKAERLAIAAEKPLYNSRLTIASSVHLIIDTLGPGRIEAQLGVTKFSLLAAKRDRLFPARWYAPLRAMCDEDGIDCPLDAFRWLTPVVSA